MANERTVQRLRRVPIINAANLLTVIRMILVPVFVIVVVVSGMVSPGWRIAAGLTFGLAALTDFADGRMARRFSLVTRFGKVTDPLADKMLVYSALALLTAYNALPWWVTAMFLARGLGVVAIRFWAVGQEIIVPSRGGNLASVLQIFAISWYLYPLPKAWSGLAYYLILTALVVAIATGGDYVLRVLRSRRLSAP